MRNRSRQRELRECVQQLDPLRLSEQLDALRGALLRGAGPRSGPSPVFPRRPVRPFPYQRPRENLSGQVTRRRLRAASRSGVWSHSQRSRTLLKKRSRGPTRILNSFLVPFLAWTPTRLGLRLMKIACDILNAGIPIEPPFLRGKLASASQLPKVIDGGLEYGSQFFHREEMSRRLLTGLEIAVQTQLNCLTHQVDDCLIITSRSLLKRLDIALPPIT